MGWAMSIFQRSKYIVPGTSIRLSFWILIWETKKLHKQNIQLTFQWHQYLSFRTSTKAVFRLVSSYSSVNGENLVEWVRHLGVAHSTGTGTKIMSWIRSLRVISLAKIEIQGIHQVIVKMPFISRASIYNGTFARRGGVESFNILRHHTFTFHWRWIS